MHLQEKWKSQCHNYNQWFIVERYNLHKHLQFWVLEYINLVLPCTSTLEANIVLFTSLVLKGHRSQSHLISWSESWWLNWVSSAFSDKSLFQLLWPACSSCIPLQTQLLLYSCCSWLSHFSLICCVLYLGGISYSSSQNTSNLMQMGV